MIRFHSPGIPIIARKLGTLKSLQTIKDLGLDGIEVEFTHGVRMSDELAEQIGEEAEKLDLTITVHGPFWINLNSQDKSKQKSSINYILESARKAHLMKAKSVTFHSAYMHSEPDEKVLETVKNNLEKTLEQMEKESLNVRLAPELTGKESQFGSIDHLVDLVLSLDKKISLCIDFSHNYARTIGKENGEKAFQNVLDKIRDSLGEKFLKNLHMHTGGMIYGPKGEKKHRPLDEEDEFDWQTLLKVLKKNKVGGWMVVETPDIEESTKLAKEKYQTI